jgi:hypothetical protein
MITAYRDKESCHAFIAPLHREMLMMQHGYMSASHAGLANLLAVKGSPCTLNTPDLKKLHILAMAEQLVAAYSE